MSEMKHSKWSASGFEQRMLCPGSAVLQAGLPRSTSEYAAEGTAAHQVLTWALQDDRPASAYVGRVIEADGFTFECDDDMAGHVQVCIDYVKDVAGDTGAILVDRRVNYSRYLGVEADQAWGTLDVTVLLADEIVTIDFKYGRGVEVLAGDSERNTPNPQLALYALGALEEFGDFGDFSRVRLVISQPRTSKKPSEFDLSVEALQAWGFGPARQAVAVCTIAENWIPTVGTTGFGDFLAPGEKQCKFCRVKATCPALRDTVTDVVFADVAATADEFTDLDLPTIPKADDGEMLAACLSKVDLIEDWCKAVRAEVERRLLAGDQVPGYKLVQGKQGNRTWTDPLAAENLLREKFRLPIEKAYDLKLISPTSAEKLFKAGEIGPRQWPKAEALITRSPGKPHVAPASDSRPALVVTPVAEDFTPVTTDISDLA